MLSDQDKKDILEDALNPKRRGAFADSRQRAMTPMTWEQYFTFLKATQNFFSFSPKPHKITGEHFKL